MNNDGTTVVGPAVVRREALNDMPMPTNDEVAFTLFPKEQEVDKSGSIMETQLRLEALCKEQGHLIKSVIDHNKHEARHICERCGNTEIRTLTIVK